MSRNTTTALVVAILVVLVAVVGFAIMKAKHTVSNLNQTPTASASTETVMASPANASEGAVPQESMSQTTISITSSGFSPDTVTIKAGETVTWVNNDTTLHQVNSDPHPTHTNYPPLNTIGRLNPSEQKSLSFPTAGSYGFHDHLNPQFKGTVVVQ